jgi:hypothetical protein
MRKTAWHLLDCSSLVEYVSSSAAARPEADADASSTSTFATASLEHLAASVKQDRAALARAQGALG